MSNSLVRSAVDDVANNSTTLTFKIYDTVNKHQDPTDDTWYTYAFGPSYSRKVAHCIKQEEGSIEFYCMTQPGTGSSIISSIEADMQLIADSIEVYAENNNINLRISGIHPIVDLGGDSGSWIFHVQLDYQLMT